MPVNDDRPEDSHSPARAGGPALGRAAVAAPLDAEAQRRFERGVLPHLDAAYNLARHLLRDPDDAADAVQEASLLAVRHYAGFRGGSERAWLLAIVRNASLSLMRRRKARGETVPFEEGDAGADELVDPGGGATAFAPARVSGPEADFLRTVATEQVRRELDRLPAVFKEAIVLRELEDLSYKEIAHVTGVPVGTVMSRLARGRRLLAAALTAEART